jgi:hypothetical protein
MWGVAAEVLELLYGWWMLAGRIACGVVGAPFKLPHACHSCRGRCVAHLHTCTPISTHQRRVHILFTLVLVLIFASCASERHLVCNQFTLVCISAAPPACMSTCQYHLLRACQLLARSDAVQSRPCMRSSFHRVHFNQRSQHAPKRCLHESGLGQARAFLWPSCVPHMAVL